MELFHNPRCAKSRATLQLLEKQGFKPEIRKYLDDTPSKSELKAIIDKLQIAPKALVRKGEKIYKEEFKGSELNDEAWIQAMVDHPKLIERPILIHGDKAAIGRPPEDVLKIL